MLCNCNIEQSYLRLPVIQAKIYIFAAALSVGFEMPLTVCAAVGFKHESYWVLLFLETQGTCCIFRHADAHTQHTFVVICCDSKTYHGNFAGARSNIRHKTTFVFGIFLPCNGGQFWVMACVVCHERNIGKLGEDTPNPEHHHMSL